MTAEYNKVGENIVRMLENDNKTIHLLWNCTEGKTISLGKHIMPENTPDPLDYLRLNGLIDPASQSAFDVLCAQIEQGIISGADENSAGLDISMRLSDDDPFELFHFYALFLRDANCRIISIHINIRPYNERETLFKQVLDTFTSDKNPKIYSQRCADLIRRKPDSNIAFIQFDVERFKLINETYGVEFGDELLHFFNDALSVICSNDQPFCRLTADVYMIVTEFDEREDLVQFVRMIESRLSGYKGIEYRLIFGIAEVEDRTLHTRRHGDNAALARQQIHGNALENIGFYNKEMKDGLQLKQTIEDDMHKALLNNEFVMYLQPKHSISSGRIIGAEALARWQHPERGLVPPAKFIPLFEQNGFILKLDQIIWESACRKVREWIDAGIEPVPISVNVSREYLHTFDVIGRIKGLIKKYDIPIHYIQLEITESVDAEGVDDIVKKMKDAGFTMLMDDFGSGYSSLNMLKSTQFDVLKIDRAFLSEFMESTRGRKIISHTISMSQDLGLEIIAEGVETLEQAKFLSNCGCDAAQGFYYSKPLEEKVFDKRLIEVNK